MIDTDEYERILKDDDGRNNVFALDLLAEVKRLRKEKDAAILLLDAADKRARLAIESHPNADEMLKEMIR